jgi:hypothetical protein
VQQAVASQIGVECDRYLNIVAQALVWMHYTLNNKCVLWLVIQTWF